jgi:hypothetical protein
MLHIEHSFVQFELMNYVPVSIFHSRMMWSFEPEARSPCCDSATILASPGYHWDIRSGFPVRVDHVMALQLSEPDATLFMSPSGAKATLFTLFLCFVSLCRTSVVGCNLRKRKSLSTCKEAVQCSQAMGGSKSRTRIHIHAYICSRYIYPTE